MATTVDLPHALRGLLPDPLGAQLAPRARLVMLRPGQIVIGHQDRTRDVFVVVEGRLRVELVSLNGREVILAEVGPGEITGEFAALDDQPRSASVGAITACTLIAIPGDAFVRCALGDPGSAWWLTQRLVRQIRLLNERNFELNALAVRNRLHCELLRLCIDAGIADNGAVIAPAPTHAHLASRIGTHREAVTREMQYLQKQGIVRQQGRAMTIADVARLAEIVRAASGDVGVVQRAGLGPS
ncbi:MAG: Crp/Fnr family transcriptional regulator [Novosphingobium sp.]|jgi:CRP/FNR family cyclic AMP-dependent transcriptional regulator|nr:Crp/Fnr family transcriptional regulator [Novosphingobium sp.]